MKKFRYKTWDFSGTPSSYSIQHADKILGLDWELVSIVSFKEDGNKYYRAYFKREVTE